MNKSFGIIKYCWTNLPRWGNEGCGFKKVPTPPGVRVRWRGGRSAWASRSTPAAWRRRSMRAVVFPIGRRGPNPKGPWGRGNGGGGEGLRRGGVQIWSSLKPRIPPLRAENPIRPAPSFGHLLIRHSTRETFGVRALHKNGSNTSDLDSNRKTGSEASQ